MELPSDTTIRWLVRRYAALLAREEDSNVKHPMVLPNGQFFPDAFDGDAGSVNLLFWRLQEHSGLTDVDVELRFVDDGGAAPAGGGCSGGSCGTHAGAKVPPPVPPIARLPDAYRVDVLISQARTPVALTAYLAIALARIHIEETGGLDEFPEEEWRSTCELCAISLGFGVLLANASYMFSKGCGGVNVDRGTSLLVTEVALGIALFVAQQESASSQFVASLETTQKSAWSEAKLWADSNQKLIRRLRRDPAEVAKDEMLDVAEAKPWLARVLGIGGKKKRTLEVFDEDGFSQFEAEMKGRTGNKPERKKDPKIDELRALVDESLEEVRSAREEA
jgi:hypothetical protein